MYQGKSIQVTRFDGPNNTVCAELKFDRQNESVNKFDAATIAELNGSG